MRVPEKMTALMVEIESEAEKLVVHVVQNLISFTLMKKSAQVKEVSATQLATSYRKLKINVYLFHVFAVHSHMKSILSARHMNCILTRAINVERKTNSRSQTPSIWFVPASILKKLT